MTKTCNTHFLHLGKLELKETSDLFRIQITRLAECFPLVVTLQTGAKDAEEPSFKKP